VTVLKSLETSTWKSGVINDMTIIRAGIVAVYDITFNNAKT